MSAIVEHDGMAVAFTSMRRREIAAIHESYRAEIAGLERENERMREALLRIAEGPSDGIVAVARRGLGI